MADLLDRPESPVIYVRLGQLPPVHYAGLSRLCAQLPSFQQIPKQASVLAHVGQARLTPYDTC